MTDTCSHRSLFPRMWESSVLRAKPLGRRSVTSMSGDDGSKVARTMATVALLLAACLAALPLAAKTLRFASGFDPQSLDPHALALQYQTRVASQIYESLVFRDRDFVIEPALAVSWQQLEPKRWRFKLRPGVKFHDGTPFTADDVAFSSALCTRTRSAPSSSVASWKRARSTI